MALSKAKDLVHEMRVDAQNSLLKQEIMKEQKYSQAD